MNGFWQGVYTNKAFWAILYSSIAAQVLKVVFGVIKDRRFNFYWVLGTGGMPSAHSAAVVSLVICVAKETGSSSALFALSLLFAIITMFDAQTWRRSIGFQAKVLNRMMEDFQEGKKIEEERLRELVGHTPIEVLVGALIGTVITLSVYH
ncbi:MAG: divergent PAP2 family protein [Candidatus Omnitrophica bacterium]|nr:divergent PAP2 family protein [Candidatus Omnitrophota bacterium]MBU2251708.1 divergent PAP2 family protein [Candidatus Omnitrophota bacterium]MBU2265586.1 divergent PAP2 family protein [Candidatus Omnitrophota bacterium]MBU2473147.1 divergent PAP2 family protein [Candidatus Omnitrophota bacterium]